jgi:hypothetical protein
LNTIDDKNFSRKDYINALKTLESYVSLMGNTFDFTNEEVDFSKIREECLSDIREIRKKIKNMPTTHCKISNNRKPRNKRKRIIKRKSKLKKLYAETRHSFPSAVINKNNKFLTRFYYKGKDKKYYKRLSNKRLRTTSNKFLNNFGTYSVKKGGSYKKIFDYYWNLY